MIDKNFEDFMLEQQEHRARLKELEKTKLDDPELARKARKGLLKDNEENEGDSHNKIEASGNVIDNLDISDTLMSKPKILPLFGEDQVDEEISANKMDTKEAVDKDDKRDVASIRREDFLNIVKKDSLLDNQDEDDTPDLSKGIKIKPDAP